MFKLYFVHKLLLIFQSSKNSNNSKKCIVNNVQLLLNHYNYNSYTLIKIIVSFMIELNIYNIIILYFKLIIHNL
jgi:hypothetical protein